MVNFNADLRRAYRGAQQAAIGPAGDDVVSAQLAAIDAMKQVVSEKLRLLAGDGAPTNKRTR
jgi:hypothetical protein